MTSNSDVANHCVISYRPITMHGPSKQRQIKRLYLKFNKEAYPWLILVHIIADLKFNK